MPLSSPVMGFARSSKAEWRPPNQRNPPATSRSQVHLKTLT